MRCKRTTIITVVPDPYLQTQGAQGKMLYPPSNEMIFSFQGRNFKKENTVSKEAQGPFRGVPDASLQQLVDLYQRVSVGSVLLL